MKKLKYKYWKVMGWGIAFLLLWYVILPYGKSLLYDKNYKTVPIYIPKTKEKLYMINYSYPFSGLGNRIELSSCDWRIFCNEDKEFWYPKSSMGIEYSESPQTFYYKVSNDTLYISVYEAIIVPKLWKSKTIIIQEEESHFVTKQGIHGWKVVDEEKRKNRLEKLGYRRFP